MPIDLQHFKKNCHLDISAFHIQQHSINEHNFNGKLNIFKTHNKRTLERLLPLQKKYSKNK